MHHEDIHKTAVIHANKAVIHANKAVKEKFGQIGPYVVDSKAHTLWLKEFDDKMCAIYKQQMLLENQF